MITIEEVGPELLPQIAALRLAVWEGETTVDRATIPEGGWLGPLDPVSRHWVARDEAGTLVAAGGLSIHATLADNPDGYLWLERGLAVPAPVANIFRLVVAPAARGQGVAGRINQLRLDAAKAAGARSVIATASDANTRLLERQGFEDTGIRVTFPNRPLVVFRGLQLVF